MDMEELLGLDAGDFDDVEFSASDEEQEEANAKESTTGAAASGGAEANGSSSVSDGVAPVAAGTSTPSVTTTIKV